MAIRPRGRKRSLSKKVSSFNMYMDQTYQVRAIMEATAAVCGTPIRWKMGSGEQSKQSRFE